LLPPNRGDYERVAVVGGGVSGMTVAHDLTRIGVPVYRLPRDLVMAEIQAILSLGVDLKCNMRLGRDFTIPSLRADGFAAIFLGIGLPKGRKLVVPGNDLEGVYDGMEFLRSFNEGTPMPLGERIVVVGGGNVAYDVARSALRPAWMKSRGEEIEEINRDQQMAYDVARSALRKSGDKEVHVVCLESRDEMPADDIEVEEGKEEGVKLHARRGPKSIEGRDGKLKSFRAVKCVSVFDETKKFSPKFDEADVEEIPADTVIFAIGQTSDLSFLDLADGVASERGFVKVNPETYQTTAPDVFACGDIAHGPRLFIDAVASAQIAARSMHDYLRGTRPDVVLRRNWKPATYTMSDGWEELKRENPPALDPARRASSIAIVEENFSEADARHQASRCLRCNINTVFDTSKCVGCNGCVDVCPEKLIRRTPLRELLHVPEWAEMLGNADPAEFGAVLKKDESTCLRCAMCASRCPTHAITMQHFDFAWECVSIPAPNGKINYGTAV
jgi:formate dehydrogenase beta subunit